MRVFGCAPGALGAPPVPKRTQHPRLAAHPAQPAALDRFIPGFSLFLCITFAPLRRQRLPCDEVQASGKASRLKFRTCQVSRSRSSRRRSCLIGPRRHIKGCPGIGHQGAAAPPTRARGPARLPRSRTTAPAPRKAPRLSHRVALVAATKSTPHPCPPQRVRLRLGELRRRPAGPPAPAVPTSLSESTHLLSKIEEPARAVAVALAWAPRLRYRLYRTPPFVSGTQGAPF